MMKILAKTILGISLVSFIWLSTCIWDSLGWDINPDAQFPRSQGSYQEDQWKSELWEQVDIKDKNSIITRLLDVFNIDIVKNDDHKFLNYVKAILNVALWLLSMVALIMTIYTFYLMFFTENDKAAGKAKWNLVGIFVALVIIGLARLIVSFIFWWYKEQWQDRNDEIEKANLTMITSDTNNHLNDQIYLTV